MTMSAPSAVSSGPPVQSTLAWVAASVSPPSVLPLAGPFSTTVS